MYGDKPSSQIACRRPSDFWVGKNGMVCNSCDSSTVFDIAWSFFQDTNNTKEFLIVSGLIGVSGLEAFTEVTTRT
jgi:hypothetical protein